MTHKQKIRILEFVVFGVVMNMLDNLISVLILGDVHFRWSMLVIIFLVVLPFGFISEIIVDHPNFWKRILPAIGLEFLQAEREVEKEIKNVEERWDK